MLLSANCDVNARDQTCGNHLCLCFCTIPLNMDTLTFAVCFFQSKLTLQQQTCTHQHDIIQTDSYLSLCTVMLIFAIHVSFHSDGDTPLHDAIRGNVCDVVALLRSVGASE